MTSTNKSVGLITSLFVAFACGFYSIMLGQDANWDLLNYHLYNPYAFLNDRIEIDLAPAGLQSFFSPLLDILYFSAISHLSPRTVGFLIGFIQGFNFFLVYKIASVVLRHHRHCELLSLFLATAAVLTVGFQAGLGTVMHDSLSAIFPLLSLLLVISTIGRLNEADQRGVLGLIIGAGLVAGTGIGLKLTSAIYALPICLSMLLFPVHWLRRLRLAFLFGIFVLLALFVTGGYWLYEMWRLFGNPLFPQYNHIFQGELAAFEAISDRRFVPKTLFDKVFYPVIFTLDPYRTAEIIYRQFSWLLAYVTVPVLLLSKIVLTIRGKSSASKWNPEARIVFAFFCLAYLLWVNMFGIYRYLAVLEVLIPLLLFMMITFILSDRYATRAALIIIAVLTLVNLRGAADWGHAPWADSVTRMETSALSEQPEAAVVYLGGQPLAWIIPTLDIGTPFVQIVPNMPVSEAYWQRAKMAGSARNGKRYLVFDPGDPSVLDRMHINLSRLGLDFNAGNCDSLVGYIGTARRDYSLCEIQITESE